ncbi:uncharacterized protein BJ212DRAFT_1502252 [Suillus subaureus]|uniref:Uncharacterized protein n=1 Tax=Suillus subaureus TaxID=48587 RepID=A0A9P7EBX9_9AGAM|nr:uncharacterized protein BJ212DRAFT_1502252 [Suillus subaureus]KAG1816767.1 hypothetical protein BJ212DRAFT_1502252 [Suillus subaureus]
MLTYKLHVLSDYVKSIWLYGTTDNYSMQVQHPSLHFVDQEPLPYCSPESHYQVSTSKKFHWDISAWLGKHTDDIAVHDFLPHLKEHVLGCLLGNQYEGDEMQFMAAQQNSIHIINNQIYQHKVLHIKYTTYDLSQAQDSLNPCTRADVMVLAHEDENENLHPYWYARAIGIFHVLVQHNGPESQSSTPQ